MLWQQLHNAQSIDQFQTPLIAVSPLAAIPKSKVTAHILNQNGELVSYSNPVAVGLQGPYSNVAADVSVPHMSPIRIQIYRPLCSNQSVMMPQRKHDWYPVPYTGVRTPGFGPRGILSRFDYDGLMQKATAKVQGVLSADIERLRSSLVTKPTVSYGNDMPAVVIYTGVAAVGMSLVTLHLVGKLALALPSFRVARLAQLGLIPSGLNVSNTSPSFDS